MLRLDRARNRLFIGLVIAVAALAVICVLSPPDSRRAMANSAVLAAGATAIALPLGALLAVLLARFELPGRPIAAVLLGLLLFLPLYVQLSGWDACFGKLGWLSLARGSMADPFLAGMRGAIWVHAMAAAPWVTLLVAVGLLQVDRAQEEAALLVASPRVVLWWITLPQSIPFIAAAALWVVVSTTSEMTVTNIYLMNPSERTLTEQFYMAFALSADAGDATLTVLPGIVALAVLIGATLWTVSRLSTRTLMYGARGDRFFAGPWHLVATALLWLIVTLLVAIPIASLISKAGFSVVHSGTERIRSWSVFKCITEVATAPRRFAREFGWTLLVAAVAASVAIIAGSWLAWRAQRDKKWRMVAVAAIVLGFAIPGPLIGVGLIALLNHDLPPRIISDDGSLKSWLLVLYDETPLAPILAQAIRAFPIAVLLAWHSLATLSDDVLEAAALDGLSRRQVFWRIALLQRQSAFCAAWLAAFAIAAGDLAWVHLVTPPGMDLIQRRVFGLVHSGVEEQVAAISLVNTIAYSIVAAVVFWLIRRGQPCSLSSSSSGREQHL
jgi:iron(III) transport system permease protein